MGYNARWGSLTKKVLLLSKKYKTMAKSVDCECRFDPPLLFEFSLACTILEKTSATTFSVLNNWYIDVRRDRGGPPEEEESDSCSRSALISWQCYDSCHGGNNFLSMLEKSGELIRMLCDKDERDFVEDKLQLRLLVRKQHNDKQHIHTFTNIDRDIVLDGTIIFCYRGLPPKKAACTCLPHVLRRVTFSKSFDELPKNNLVLGSWPFPHEPFDQVPTAAAIIGANKKQQQIDDHPSWCPSCLETGDICHQACDVQLVTTLPQEEELKFDIYPRSAPFSTTMSTEDTPTTSYVVVPRKDYEGLFNKQYAQLTSLQKRVDPDLEREAFFETTLKTHYPKVYQEMIKNDFLLTRPTAIQHVAAAENAAEKNERIQMAMQRQLDQVASGRQRHVKLSNPLYLFTQ